MSIEELIDSVPDIPVDRRYWFVRTDDGSYFDTFYENKFIGIGWNEITLEELKNPTSVDKIRSKIAKIEKYDLTEPQTKRNVTTIYNKLIHFIELKRGDVVIIPSRGSSRFAFGIISNTSTIIDNSQSFDCDFYKRKKVNWLAIKSFTQLDPKFYQIKISRHTISRIDRYSKYIDSVLNNLYSKDGNAHYVININTTNQINVDILIDLINKIQILIKEVNRFYSFGESIENNSISLYLQSPGKMEFKLPSGKSLIIAAFLISSLSCNDHETISREPMLTQFKDANQAALDTIVNYMSILETQRERINHH